MRPFSPWTGVRLATHEVGLDPDAPCRTVLVPVGWGDNAARGLLALAGPAAPARALRLPELAERWIAPLDRRAREGGGELGATLHHLLALRQACPDAPAWTGDTPDRWRFALHLAAFADPETGLDAPCLESAIDALLIAAGHGGDTAPVLRVAGLDGMLAALGLRFGSEAGRDLAVDALRLVRRAAGRRPLVLEASGMAGPAEALLGVETAGIAPAFAPVDEHGRLRTATRARLAALGLSSEDALARTLAGDAPLPNETAADANAMRDAVAPLLDRVPPPSRATPRVVPAATVEAGGHEWRPTTSRPLPARAKGFTQKVTIGGHRVFVRTGEYEDGSLGEMSITTAGRDGAGARALFEAVSQAISIGLQHGVPLAAYVEAFAHARCGPGGTVDGDGAIAHASSPLDYAVRALSEAYGGRHVPDPVPDDVERPTTPLLPFGPPAGGAAAAEPRQRALRLVRA